MGYERYGRGNSPQRDYYGRQDPQDYGRDYGSGRDYTSSSARDYQAAGYDDGQRQSYGARDYGYEGYGRRDEFSRDRGYGRSGGDRSGYERSGGYGAQQGEYRGSYAHDGRRFEDYGRERGRSDDRYGERGGNRGGQRGYGAQPQGYDYEDRGFLARAGDEVRSWFGDEDAERRRDADARYDERAYAEQDRDYHSWRRGQIDAFDRDYHEYRSENRQKFQNEFSTWRTARQGQRDSLSRVTEHMDVVGSDGQHVGTVDKVRGDRILLTKNDADAGGRHHSIPSRWIDKVDTGITLSKTAEEAKKAWRDEENSQAMFGYGDRSDGRQSGRNDDRQSDRENDSQSDRGGLNRSFSGTY